MYIVTPGQAGTLKVPQMGNVEAKMSTVQMLFLSSSRGLVVKALDFYPANLGSNFEFFCHSYVTGGVEMHLTKIAPMHWKSHILHVGTSQLL